MNLQFRKSRNQNLQRAVTDWEMRIESLAMQLCPADEWQHYEKKMHALLRESQTLTLRRKRSAPISVFPVWRKYRQQAKRVATLQQAFPLFKHLPLKLNGLVGDLLFK
jgi:hypothetical protein